jgi:hypothetical protein
MELDRAFILPGERVVATSPSVPVGGPNISAVTALAALCGAVDDAEIGCLGPVMASTHRPEHSGVAELRKFEVLFGRDALITARFVFDQYPELTVATVRSRRPSQRRRRSHSQCRAAGHGPGGQTNSQSSPVCSLRLSRAERDLVGLSWKPQRHMHA